MLHESARNEMRAFYRALDELRPCIEAGHTPVPGSLVERTLSVRQGIYEEMDAFWAEHPDTPPVLLKSRIHRLMAERFMPQIFPSSPFFFEMGILDPDSWGLAPAPASHWMWDRVNAGILQAHPLIGDMHRHFDRLFDFQTIGLCGIHASFDVDHHTLGYTTLFAVGVNGLLAQVREKLASLRTGSEEHTFCAAMEESLNALLLAAQRFSEKAEELLTSCTDETQRRFLSMIARTAKKIPACPPETFYEGLCMLLFTREAVASLENIGISQLGHMDRLLGPLYEADLAAGRITEEEARELLGLWMLHTDIKFHLENNEWPETSTCIQLGGCDREGNPVYNTVTRMIIEEHHRTGCVNPKLNCRYCRTSPDEYFEVIGAAVLAGHNNFVLINDDIVISGLVRSGVNLPDARMYVSGGCQETMIEGFGQTEGAGLYVSLPRLLDLSLRYDRGTEFLKPIENAASFEDFYGQFIATVTRFFRVMIDQRNISQQYLKEAIPAPLFSSTQHGCIKNARDYTKGGAKYNFSTIALVGLGTTADSLYALKKLVFEEKRLTLPEFVSVLAQNWEGHEELRQAAIALPKYGHGEAEPDALADRFLSDIAKHIFSLKNERGGRHIPSLFVYYYYSYFADALRATPDGRRDHDLASPGCAPSQLQSLTDVTAPLRTMANMNFTVTGGGSAVLDLKLPLSNGMTPRHFAAFVRACEAFRCPTLQPNFLSQQELLDAKAHPERHKDLMVRISGLSAYFVTLTDKVQDEIIARYSVNA